MPQRWMSIAWPAFLTAAILEMLVFALVDPEDLRLFGQPLPLSREGVYTLGFFAFWAVSAGACWLSGLLAKSANEINRCPLTAPERPEGCPKREGGDCA